ncbi:Zn(II)2Cys6 transcription factor [Aspergillus alliaceus]|uniref:Zn(II)2Cys6 transcription factor n=1 Tax=Petromyces alliaceus TaxID=209559 RepID=UPI0012A57333|nr:uncharacterized protein BDW43DRAFT_322627 [Aspergillus alliaceus]KAB8237212.1 hypothetical protein BDW43DRAFT_322627 [Aspergillus alliaceus]
MSGLARNIQPLKEHNRKRIYSPRSRTGCRTCRLRHVRCDESAGACTNCTSTGRSCPGYERRLPLTRKAIRGVHLYPPVASVSHTAMTSDERRCFSYYQYYTVPTLLRFFDSLVWQTFVLPVSSIEPAVFHALVALSAVHQNVEMDKNLPVTAGSHSDWQHFALEQLGRSFALLRSRCTSQDPVITEVVLVCCLLFLTLEFILGEYDNAFKHLQHGVQILSEVKAQAKDRLHPPIEKCLLMAFAHLEVQASYFGAPGPTLGWDSELECCSLGPTPQLQLHSVQEARHHLEPMMSAVVGLDGLALNFSDEDIESNYHAVLQSRQLHIISLLKQYSQALKAFRREAYFSLKPKDRRGLGLLELIQISLSLRMEMPFNHLSCNDPQLNDYTPKFLTILSLAEKIPSENSDLPSISMDTGVIPPLYFVAQRCRDYSVRWRAIGVLRSCGHREGPWDSSLLARIAIETMKLEAAVTAERDCDDIPRDYTQERPPHCKDYIIISDDWRWGRIPYRVGKSVKEWWFSLEKEDSGVPNAFTCKTGTAGWIRVLLSPLTFSIPRHQRLLCALRKSIIWQPAVGFAAPDT